MSDAPIFLLIGCLLSGCRVEQRAPSRAEGETPAQAAAAPQVVLTEIDSPAGPSSAEPFLSTAPDNSVLLSWLERKAPESKTYALKLARREGGKWSTPQTITERDDLFVNWADFPSVVAGSGDLLFAHWLQKSGKGVYAYDVRLAVSRDRGKSWSRSVVTHRDGTQTEHGFVSLVPGADSVAAVWLDGRKMTTGHGEHDEGAGPMTLRYARIDAQGKIRDEVELDELVCECCQTGMSFTDGGAVVVYRDRSPKEVRDISVVRRRGSQWSAPKPLHGDGWSIEGCPVNGPQIDSRGKQAVVAWFTAANATKRVYAAFSNDSGASFGRPIAVDAGNPVGRVDVVLLPDGAALVSWIEQVGDRAEVRVRRIRPDGRLDSPLKVAASSPARSAGVPRMTMAGNEVYVAWTEPEQPFRIRLAILPLGSRS